MAWRGNSCESGARIHLDVEDLTVQINDHQPQQQRDDDEVGNQLLGWERRLRLVERSIENVWKWRGIILEPLHVIAEPLVLKRQIPELEEDAGA